MDAMALLCNLHADGPSTLRCLREGGCATIEDLLGLPAERLAGLLGIAPAAARRFLREGLSLRERLGAELLEREEDLQVPVAAALPRAARADAGRLPARERLVLARVMNGGPGASAAVEPAPPAHPLVAGALEGLDEPLCRRLGDAGLWTLEALAECRLEELDRATALGFSRLRRLQFLARRRLRAGAGERLPARLASETREEKISLAFPARPAPASEAAPVRPVRPARPGVLVEGAPTRSEEAPGGPFA